MKLSFLFCALTLLIVSCSGKGEKELYAEAIAAHGEKNFQHSVDLFGEVVDRFSKSAYAESSLTRMAVIYNNDLHDPRKSIGAYRKFCELFPSSPDAPNALFLVGFLYNNDLHNTDSARMVYESFLQKYSTHELASSARFELENLGKDPAQVFKSNVTSQPGDNAGTEAASKQ